MDTNITNSHNTNISFEEMINTTSGLNLDLTSFLNLITEIIHKSGILNKLLDTQLDSCDIEGAIHAYYNVISQPWPFCKNIREKGLLEKFENLHNLPIEESIKIVRDYLVSATAKDCSIMLSFRPKMNGPQNLEYESVRINYVDQVYDYKVFFIDLDMKVLDKMEYYYKLDQKIVNFYKEIYRN